MSACNYNHVIFDKDAKNTQWEKTFSTNGAGETGCLHIEE